MTRYYEDNHFEVLHADLLQDGLSNRFVDPIRDHEFIPTTLLWGQFSENNSRLLLPSYYGGPDYRGCLQLAVRTPKVSQDVVSVANYESWIKILEELDPDGDYWSEEGFNHWATCFDAIFVSIKAPYLSEINTVLENLSNYPVIDEDYLCEVEERALNDIWSNMDTADRIQFCKERDLNIFAARHDYYPTDDNGLVREWLNPDNTI